MRSSWRIAALTAALALASVAGAGLDAGSAASPQVRRADLQKRIAEADDGATLRVEPGLIAGPLNLDKSVTLEGDGVVIDGGGTSRVVVLDAPNIHFRGFTVRNSGTDLAGPDACIYVTKKSRGSVVENNRLDHCAFGIWVHETPELRIENNDVQGSRRGHRSRRGNGIHLYNASELVVRGNHIVGGRDGIYVSVTEDSLIERNRIDHTRYAVHYMFSLRNRLRGNIATHSTTGYALMESKDIEVIGNEASDNKERGILFRDVQYCRIEDNTLENNGEGLFFFSSTENVVRNNLIKDNKVGMRIWAGTLRNDISDNRFVGNETQVLYIGASDLHLGEGGRGNYWSDYLGWDQTGDGIGDRPYRVDSFATRLIQRFPSAALLMRSPSLELLTHLQESLPLLSVPTVIDDRPLIGAEEP